MNHLHTRNRDTRRAGPAGFTSLDGRLADVCHRAGQVAAGFRRPDARTGALLA